MVNSTTIVSNKNQKTAEKLFYYGLFGVVGLHYFYVGKSKQGRYHLILTFFLLIFTYAFCSSSIHTNTGELITFGEKISFTLKTWLPFMLAGIPTLIKIKTGTFQDKFGLPLHRFSSPACTATAAAPEAYKISHDGESVPSFDMDFFVSNFPPCTDIVLCKAIYIAVYHGKCSTSLLQRKLQLSYPSAALIMDKLEQLGVVGPYIGAHPREVLVTVEQLPEFISNPSVQAELSLTDSQNQDSMYTKMSDSDFDQMDGHTFEKFCADVLRKNGFSDVEVTVGSGDFGTDILAKKDGITYAIQCKCYSGNIGIAAVQEANSGRDYYNAMVGAVMTNRYFTPQAKVQAEKSKILLWDRDRLNEMIHQAQKITQ